MTLIDRKRRIALGAISIVVLLCASIVIRGWSVQVGPPLPLQTCTSYVRFRDECSTERRAIPSQVFGLASIDTPLPVGKHVERIRVVDGYDEDLVAITVSRQDDGPVDLRVSFPRSGKGRRVSQLMTQLPAGEWSRIDQRLKPVFTALPPAPARDGKIYLDCWTYVAEEAIGRGVARGPSWRIKAESACRPGPATTIGMWLVAFARVAFPACAALEVRQHRNEEAALSACGRLTGDRMAAAEVMNRHRGLFDQFDIHKPAASDLIHPRAAIDWQGRRPRGGNAASFWRANLDRGDEVIGFDLTRVEGLPDGRVRLEGWLRRWVEWSKPHRSCAERAAVTTIWAREKGRPYQITDAAVGPWKPNYDAVAVPDGRNNCDLFADAQTITVIDPTPRPASRRRSR